MQPKSRWCQAVVTRAQPIGQGMRLIEFVVAEDLPPFDPRSRTMIRMDRGDVTMLRNCICLPAPAGRLRIAVPIDTRADVHPACTLVEGARARVTLPCSPPGRGRGCWPGRPSARPLAPAISGVSVRIDCRPGERVAGHDGLFA